MIDVQKFIYEFFSKYTNTDFFTSYMLEHNPRIYQGYTQKKLKGKFPIPFHTFS